MNAYSLLELLASKVRRINMRQAFCSINFLGDHLVWKKGLLRGWKFAITNITGRIDRSLSIVGLSAPIVAVARIVSKAIEEVDVNLVDEGVDDAAGVLKRCQEGEVIDNGVLVEDNIQLL